MEQLPYISILLAVRNEEENLGNCLDALLALNYPKEKLEILVGNDASEDDTVAIAEKYSQQYDFIRLYSIEEKLGGAEGKANVLAQLAHFSKGEFLFFTDADMEVPVGWIRDMLKGFDAADVGVVTGVSYVEGNGLWNTWQAMEWLYALSLVKVMAILKQPVTAMGNNMAVRRAAYEATGGYEQIPFSVAEDFALFWSMRKVGWDFRQLFTVGVLSRTQPVKTLLDWLKQRKRWMQGAMMLPWYWQLALVLHSCLLPVLLFFLFISPQWILLLSFSLISIRSFWIGSVLHFLRIKKGLWSVFYFEPTYTILYSLLLIYYLLPVNVEWKGREYQ
ncbi:glycosyltransferase [Limibacter armeniacum]|uniref:glycosyltransferase n=1 Tax=Limibacter armeniacum TaxID=466084 RepID=UPI002FE5D05E